MQFCLPTGGPFRPRIVLHELLREEEPRSQRLAPSPVFYDPRLHIIDADPLDPWCGPLQIAGLLAIKLGKSGAVIERLLLSGDLA